MLLHLGSTSSDVGRVEDRLREFGLYSGGTDNTYGSGVEAAVQVFQQSHGLTPDGVVGDQTWALLFSSEAADTPPANPLVDAPLTQRCLALTGTFETSMSAPDCYAGLGGDFDGQGLSFGVAQWNIGQCTLQPLLAEMLSGHEDVMSAVFGDRLDDLRTMLQSPRAVQLAWARGIQDPVRHVVLQPWKGFFQALGRTPEFQAIQVGQAASIHQAALQLCARFGVTTERAVALMFDIRVQNYSISAASEAAIREDFAAIPADSAPMDIEVAKLRSIANRRAEASRAEYVEDVRARKLAIANGAGTVHGVVYDLERQFGIGLRDACT
jgi:hypothetical protein